MCWCSKGVSSHIYEELCSYNVWCFFETISSTNVCLRRFVRRRRWTRAQSKSRSQRSGATSPLRSQALLKPPCSIPGFVWTIVIRHYWRVWPCLYHLVQSSLVLLEPPWHVTAERPEIASCNIYHNITSERSGLALTITNLTSWPLPTFLILVSPTCILKTPAHHLTTNDGKNICMIVKNQYYYYRREILLAWIYFLLNMVVICSLYTIVLHCSRCTWFWNRQLKASKISFHSVGTPSP